MRGGGGANGLQTSRGRFPNFKRHFIALYVNSPDKVTRFECEVTDDVIGHVKLEKVRLFGIDELGEQNTVSASLCLCFSLVSLFRLRF